MKFSNFKFEGKQITNELEVKSLLSKNKFYWLNDAEFENADVDIINNTLVWKSGNWYYGIWQYGIWQGGTWYDGVWENGIWESGDFNGGKFKSGIWVEGNINGGDVNITQQ